MRFANLELRLALATIVRNADIEVQNRDVDPDLGTQFKPADEVTATVTSR